jgi:hypothetical protein
VKITRRHNPDPGVSKSADLPEDPSPTRLHVLHSTRPTRKPTARQEEEAEYYQWKFTRDSAKKDWSELRSAVMANGGIRPSLSTAGGIQAAGFRGKRSAKNTHREDISGIPSSLIRYNSRFTEDQIASQFGMDTHEFANFVESVHENYRHAEDSSYKFKKPRKLPKLKHIRHGRARVVKMSEVKPKQRAAPKVTRRGDGVSADGRTKTKTVYVRPHDRGCPR